MAIDSLNKRASTSHFGLWDAIAPTPDGSLASAEDRYQCNWLYSALVPSDFPTDPDVFRRSARSESTLQRTPSTESTYRRTADSNSTLRRMP